MKYSPTKPAFGIAAAALLAMPMASVSAQELEAVAETTSATTSVAEENQINVFGSVPTDLSGLPEGPELEGILSARNGNTLLVTSEDGSHSRVSLSAATNIAGRGGFLGLGRDEAASSQLLTGLPVEVRTVEWDGALVASRIRFSNNDLETARMIHGGTAQQFALHGEAIEENAAATEALRGRVANIDQYNVKDVANVYFDTGKWNLTPAAQAELCSIASQAEATDNALLLVVGYTDSTGSQEFNQVLSERRAGGVVNYLQQQCGWAPYRMMTPTGMAEADPLADNTTAAGKAQNRRVAVNILVSKAVDTTPDMALR